ncbi:MAG: adenosine deaminase [Acidimicrobiia bacterium]|nr:adenosine deaminase [Acidimicrobiia bacterium]MDH3470326.1 adenosine deaminase [Acidimicrobiia bacterium]
MVEAFARSVPKAELHLHIEGTLEPEMMMELATRNNVALAFPDVDAIRAAYEFSDLQSFLDIYYVGAEVLRTDQDFHDLMLAYLWKAHADNVRHAEMFFDAQTHINRGVPFASVMDGFRAAREEGFDELGVSTELIICFLRHLDEGAAMATLEEALPYRDQIIGVGLDSSEVDNPPERFAAVFDRARAEGFHTVAHAGEEGPPSYVTGALDFLGAERIDHGIRAREDDELIQRLADEEIPLTMCPISNVKLRVFDRLQDHSLKEMLERGVNVTINSDDPSYFGGYIGDNYAATAVALELTKDEVATIARNSVTGSFASEDRKAEILGEIDEFVRSNS